MLLSQPKLAARTTLLILALLSFILSALPTLPSRFIERWFARGAFPRISTFFGFVADAVPFAWLDVLIPAGLIFIIVCVRKRRWMPIGLAAAAAYLVFFWSWGLNYHREPLLSKVYVESADMAASVVAALTQRAAQEINSLYPQVQATPYDDAQVRRLAEERVGRVIQKLDGTVWRAATRIKISAVATPWFRFAGIDGLFNPLVHEPILNPNVLNIERPFVMAHELAHVRGYPDEGDANFVGLLATLMSDNPRLRYSGWLELWLYLRTRGSDSLLDAGPRNDLQRIFDRLRSERIVWISNLQSTILDLFLKANSVPEGVQSYSRIVILAAGTQQVWDGFR